MKKNDWIIIIICLSLAGGFSLYLFTAGQKKGDQAVVTVAGEQYGAYSLNQDQKIEITGAGGGKNTLVIEDGYADMTDADCPDKLCVRQRKIRSRGEAIVCLPHKVIVEIKGKRAGEIDSLVQ